MGRFVPDILKIILLAGFAGVILPHESVSELSPAASRNLLLEGLDVEEFRTEPGEKLSLAEASRIAWLQNIDLLTKRLDRQSYARNLGIAKSIYDTEFGMQADYSQNLQEPDNIVMGSRAVDGRAGISLDKKIPTGTALGLALNTARASTDSPFTSLNPYYRSEAAFSVKQPLLKNFFGFTDRKKIQQVKIDLRKFDYQTLDEMESILLEIRRRYWSLAWAYQNMKLKRAALDKAQEFYKITQDQLEVGLTEAPDVYAAEANVRNRVLENLRVRNEFYAASDALKVRLNAPEVVLVLPGESIAFEPVVLDLRRQIDRALENRRDLKQARLELEKQGIEVRIRRNERLPDLDFEGSYAATSLDREMASSQGEVFSFNHPRYFAGFTFAVNLEQSEERAHSAQAKAALESAQALLEKMQMEIIRDVSGRLRDLELARIRVEQTGKVQKLQRMKLEEEERQFRVGRSTAKTIIDYQEDLIIAESKHLYAMVRHHQALDNWLRATSRLLSSVAKDAGGVEAVLE
ncbi:MAG: hypothetical protein A2Z83_01045 [Omnitrophica bacterium GWA2_52_8]|nr:MAG: hypothetical protein A2Z83_01045 [Omnitrophica bacterium GWA2_52_8]